MIVGYSLAHNQLFAPVFAESLGLVPKLKESGFVDTVEQVIIGQKLLRAEYQKSGLMGKMDKILYNHLSKEFRYYLASIAVANSSSLNFVHTSGYRKVYESDKRMYFIMDILPVSLDENSYTATRTEGSIIRFRFAENADIPALAQLNKEWLKENMTDLSHGYLAASFSEDNWAFMISRGWVVLGELL